MAVAAALAFPALLALYLLKLRRRPVRVSAALFWPVARKEVQANVPFARPRFSWLLLLHLLALACAVLALGRPALTHAGPSSGDRVIILLDRGASMSATDTPDGKSRLDRAKAAADALVDAQSRGGDTSRIAIIAFGAEATTVSSFTTSRSLLHSAIDAIAPTDQPSRLAPAMDVARALAGDGEETSIACVLISDGGIADLDKVGTAPGSIKYEPIAGEKHPNNLGIVAFAGERDAQEPSQVHLFAQLANASDTPVSVGVILSLGEKELARKAVEVPAATTTGEPGVLALPLSARVTQGGVLSLRIDRADVLASDNQAWLVLPEPTRPFLWLVRPEGAPGTGSDSLPAGSWMLEAALGEMRVAGVVALSPAEYESRAKRGAFEGVSLVVFDRVSPLAKPPIPSLAFGAFVPAPGLEKLAVDVGATPAVFWSREHPVTRSLSLDSLDIAKAISLRVSGKESVEIVRGADGPLVVASNDAGVRRVVVAFDLTASNWTIQTSFPVFLASAIDWLASRGDATKCAAVLTGEAATVQAPAAGEVTVTLATGGRAAITTRASAPGPLQIGMLEHAGDYLVQGTKGQTHLAVNLCNAGESELASVQELSIAGRKVETGGLALGKREIWHWCVVMALVLLSIEWVAYARALN
jgi:hypothetical protein